jgi:hypothetical protein
MKKRVHVDRLTIKLPVSARDWPRAIARQLEQQLGDARAAERASTVILNRLPKQR